MTHTIKFSIEVGTKNGEGVFMDQVACLPFLPKAGMMLAISKGDDFRKVDEVFWNEEDGFQVYFEFSEINRVSIMKKQGWKISPDSQ